MPELEALRPMSEFDPAQTVLVHDQLNDELFEWWPARREHYERYSRRLRDGRSPSERYISPVDILSALYHLCIRPAASNRCKFAQSVMNSVLCGERHIIPSGI